MRNVAGQLFGAALIAAPALLFLYGISRLIDGLDGSYGPGLAWTIGHGLFLASFLMFVVVVFGLWSLTVRTTTAGLLVAYLASTAGLIGAGGFIRVILIDLWVGVHAGDNAQMSELDHRLHGWPLTPLSPLYESAPLFFVVGMAVLLVLLAVLKPRRVSWWSPASLCVGFFVITVNIDFLAVGSVLIGIALWPLAASRWRTSDGAN